MDRLAYDAEEAAAACGGVSRTTIDRAVAAGLLTPRHIGEKGGKKIYLAADLMAWLESLPTERPAS